MTAALDLTAAELTALARGSGRAAFPGVPATSQAAAEEGRRSLGRRGLLAVDGPQGPLASLLSSCWNAVQLVSVDMVEPRHRTVRLFHVAPHAAVEQGQVGLIYRLTPLRPDHLTDWVCRRAGVRDRGTVPEGVEPTTVRWGEWRDLVRSVATGTAERQGRPWEALLGDGSAAVVTVTATRRRAAQVAATQVGWIDPGSGAYWVEEATALTVEMTPVTAGDLRAELDRELAARSDREPAAVPG